MAARRLVKRLLGDSFPANCPEKERQNEEVYRATAGPPQGSGAAHRPGKGRLRPCPGRTRHGLGEG